MTLEQKVDALEKMAIAGRDLNHTFMDILKQTQIIIDANNADIDDFAERIERIEERLAIMEELNQKNIAVINSIAKVIIPPDMNNDKKNLN